MANKSTSLNSIKTCFNKIKTWVSGENKKLEEKIAVNRQTIGYESRNLFDFDAWFSSIKSVQGKGSSFSKSDGNGITITSGSSTDAYTIPYGAPGVDGQYLPFYIKVQPNTTYILSFTATEPSFNVYVFFFTDTGIHYSSETADELPTETLSFTTPKDTKYISVRVAVKKENTTITFSNFQLQLANAKTDDTYQPYTPTVNDRLSVLEGLIIKKVFANTNAPDSGSLATNLDESCIPICVDCVSDDGSDDLIGIPFISKQFKKWYVNIKTTGGNRATGKFTMVVYYLNIKEHPVPEEIAQAVQSSEELPSFEHLEEEPSYE